MNEFVEELCEICEIDKEDMLGQPLNIPTKHHIIPKRENGKTNFENVAILDDKTHCRFNKLEESSPELAKELNYYMYIFRGNLPKPLQDRVNTLLGLVNKNESINQKYKKKSNYQKKLKRHKR